MMSYNHVIREITHFNNTHTYTSPSNHVNREKVAKPKKEIKNMKDQRLKTHTIKCA